jgi:hypothetical protein
MRAQDELSRRDMLARLLLGMVGIGALTATGCVGHYRREERREDRREDRQEDREEEREGDDDDD